MKSLHKHSTIAAFLICLALVIGAGQGLGSDPIPGAMQTNPVAIIGATIHPVDGAPIVDGTIIFHRGKITGIGSGIPVPNGCEVVKAHGKHIYPGLIASATSLGLIEIGSVRATNDQRETGDLNPNARAASSVNPDSEHIPVARANGIALAATRPGGGLISGQSVLLRLDGWSWEDLAVQANLGLEIQWPSQR
ncbi:MAG: hypothetical protein VX949_08635, partial [Planctomycetota bacterium]|nr:hypothetical protein [Planctomycetota bacterium]